MQVRIVTPMSRLAINATVELNHSIGWYRPTVDGTICLAGKVLALQSAYSGAWGCLQGGIEKGEDIIDALVREAKEEIGLLEGNIELIRGPYLIEPSHEEQGRHGYRLGKVRHYFEVVPKRFFELRLKRDEIVAARWDEPDEAFARFRKSADSHPTKVSQMHRAFFNARVYHAVFP